MQNRRQIAVVLGVIVVGVILIALQIAAFARPIPAPATPATEDRRAL